MAVFSWQQYRGIFGKPLPKCSSGAVVFYFGSECQQVTVNTADTDVNKSSDMCMQGGPYFSTSYKAYPGQAAGGDLVFSSHKVDAAIIRSEGSCSDGDLPLCF